MKTNYIVKIVPLTAFFFLAGAMASETRLSFLNEYQIPTSTEYQGVLFGGLSGVSWDSGKNTYYAISDARNTKAEGNARFYSLKINTSRTGIKNVEIIGMTELVDQQKKSFSEQEVDGEGIALSPDKKSLLWVSELGSPLRKSALSGELKTDFGKSVPSYYNAGGDLKKAPTGLRSGLAFESISITPDGKYLFMGAESALKQDGGISTTTQSSPARILKFGLDKEGNVGELVGEYVYNVDPIPQVSRFGVSDNGLSEVLAISDTKLLVIERSGRNASDGFKDFDFNIKAYVADLSLATNIKGNASLSDIEDKKTFQPVMKKLAIDFNDYTNKPDCIEGVTFGPLIDGKKTLIFVSDNNYQPYQENKFYMFIDDKNVLM